MFTKLMSLITFLLGDPLNPHPAIPSDDVRWFADYMNGDGNPIPLARALPILRRSLFPFNYDPHQWVDGRVETTVELLKSIMAIYLYRYEVKRLKTFPGNPADFSKFLYQPERDADTSEFVHHREDHNHLLKRITNCLREDLIPGINLKHLRNALHDPTTGLTYEALTGKNKQSVPDCERMFSPGVIQYLEEKGHNNSARVVKFIHYWHKAADGRGLTEEQRSSFNKDMKGWILDDWVPWHKYDNDFSKIDVNR